MARTSVAVRSSSPRFDAATRSSLSILAVSDLHDHEVGLLISAVRSLSPDVVIFAGDGIEACAQRAGQDWLTEIARMTKIGVFAVAGNADGADSLVRFDGLGVYDLERQTVDVGPIRFIGLAGAPELPPRLGIASGAPLYTEQQAQEKLSARLAGHSGPFVLVTHAPPFGVLDLSARFSTNVGSRAVRNLLKRHHKRVPLVLCGHVHADGGNSESFRDSTIWNVASPQRDPGCIGVLNVSLHWRGEKIKIQAPSRFGSYLNWTAAGELGFLPEMQRPIASNLIRSGITRIQQLAESQASEVAASINWNVEKARIWPARARAFLTGVPIPLGPLPIGPQPRWYIDIETDPRGGTELVWAVALLRHDDSQVQQWYLTSISGQRGMLRAVSAALAALPDASVYAYSGSRFDERMLAHHLRRYGLPVPPCLANAVDLRWALSRAFVLPGRAALKEAIKAFAVTHRCGNMDGLEAALLATVALGAGRRIPHDLLRYNREDVRVLRDLVVAVEQQVGTTAPIKRRSRPSGGRKRRAADERRASELLASAGVTMEELALTSAHIAWLMQRGSRVTAAAIERALGSRLIPEGPKAAIARGSASLPSQVNDQPWVWAYCQTRSCTPTTARGGKWLVFVARRDGDEWWCRLVPAVEKGLLGSSAKIASAKPNENAVVPDETVICVYTYDSDDVADVRRVRAELRKLGVVWKIGYKTDKATRAGQYHTRGDRRIFKYWE